MLDLGCTGCSLCGTLQEDHAADFLSMRRSSFGLQAGQSLPQRSMPRETTAGRPLSRSRRRDSASAPSGGVAAIIEPLPVDSRRRWLSFGSIATTVTAASSVPACVDQHSDQSDQPPEIISRLSRASPSRKQSCSAICKGSAAGPSAHSKAKGAVQISVLSGLSPSSASSASGRCCLRTAAKSSRFSGLAARTAAIAHNKSSLDKAGQWSSSVGTQPAS
mmetsp:Transcript_28496/g.58760  ORF Transcript_28496/g.58760 Transcript_28496/m.58760 type:complete len:219 (+) Transcript_28496:15-671(+)